MPVVEFLEVGQHGSVLRLEVITHHASRIVAGRTHACVVPGGIQCCQDTEELLI